MKKLLAIFLSVLLLCTAIPFATVSAADEPTIELPTLEAKAGDVIEVPVMLKNNPGLISAMVEIEYDRDVLELCTEWVYDEDLDEDVEQYMIEKGAGWSDKYITYSQFGNGVCLMNFCNGTATKNVTKELFFTATFKVKEDAPAGTYPLNVVYDPANFFNMDMADVAFTAVNGSVTVKGDEPVNNEPTIELPHLSGAAGDVIEVPVMLKNNPGIISAMVEIEYDRDVLELCTEWVYDEDMDEDVEQYMIKKGDGWSDKYITYSQFGNGVCLMNFCNGIATKNVTRELFFTATFKIKEDAPSGTYALNVVYDPANFFNTDMEEVAFTAVNGSVTIEGVEIPDIPCEHEYDADCDPDCNLCGEIRDVHTEGIIHFDAVEAACHYNGNIEYWFCPKCECFWADEALTQLTNSKNVVLPATGSENLQHVEAKDASCNERGNIEYWYCSDCDQYWQDEALTQLTNAKNVIIDATLDHNIVHMNAVEPGCHYEGNIEYWMCTVCECVWQDEALTQLTNYKNVIIGAIGGEVVAFEAIEPGCHMNGQIAYWYCPECDQFWADEALTQITNSKNVVLPATGSENLQHVEAKDATCFENGNVEYWYCSDCDQYWTDEALTQLTNSKNVQIAATGAHNILHFDAVEAGCHYKGNTEYWMCTLCETFWADEALTMITNSKNVVIPALKDSADYVAAKTPTCTENGNVEYWTCAECEQVWTDEALTQLSNIKNVQLAPSCSYNAIHNEGIEAGCHYVGLVENWYCANCDVYYLDAECTQITNYKNLTIPALKDTADHVEAKDPTCAELGNIEYWYCAECEQVWADEALTQLTNIKNVQIATIDHTIIHFEAIEPACHYNGNIEYWFCSACEGFWQDEALTQITNSKNVVLPATGSENLQHVEAKDPTCNEYGNVEYWYCPDCEQYWTNEALTQLTNHKNVLIAPLDHNIVHVEAVEAGCHYLGNTEYWYCTNCELFWADEALTQITNSKNVIIPAIGGEVVAFEAIEPGCHMNGQIAYWYCPECEQFWQDEALTQLTNSKNVVVPATGSENLQHVEAKAPTATENGNIEYWYCPDCEQYWADEALTQLTNGKNVILPATGEVEDPEQPEDPESPETGDSVVAVVVALLALIASGVAAVLLKDKKRA